MDRSAYVPDVFPLSALFRGDIETLSRELCVYAFRHPTYQIRVYTLNRLVDR
jgi:hypothetical protein